jgi:hypothetical protein
MDLSVVWTGSQGGKIRPKTPAERAAKRKYCEEHGLCYNCECPDHSLYHCPDAAHNQPGSTKEWKGKAPAKSEK